MLKMRLSIVLTRALNTPPLIGQRNLNPLRKLPSIESERV